MGSVDMLKVASAQRLLAIGLLVITVGVGALPNWDPESPSATRADPGRRDGYGDPLPAGALARFGTTRFRHPGMARTIEFVPNRPELVSAGADSTIIFWDTATGR